jgi:predicted kinase
MQFQWRHPPVKLYVLVGIPGSGKTTYARKYLADKWRVSMDDLRFMLSVEPYAEPLQPVVVELEHTILERLLAGVNSRFNDIVVDATSVTRERRRRYIELARKYGARPVAVFIQTPLEVALARNRQRANVIPESVIYRMHQMLEPPSRDEGFEYVITVVGFSL